MSSSNFDDDDGPLRPDLIYSSDEDEFDDDDDYDNNNDDYDDLLGALGDEFIRTELNKNSTIMFYQLRRKSRCLKILFHFKNVIYEIKN
jgi:hypothetical protein